MKHRWFKSQFGDITHVVDGVARASFASETMLKHPDAVESYVASYNDHQPDTIEVPTEFGETESTFVQSPVDEMAQMRKAMNILLQRQAALEAPRGKGGKVLEHDDK